MGDTFKTTRVYRERRESDSDDERFKSTTVTRYKVNPSRGGRYERTERIVEVDDDRRARHSGHRDHHHPAEFVEYERREHTYAPDRPRSRLEERPRTIVYEQDIERERRDDWDRRSRHDRHDDDIKVEKRTEERFEDLHGHEIERYRKETEYYHQNEPSSSPVLIRQRAPDQKIIVQEAAPQAPIIVPRQEPSVIVLREREADREVGRGAPYDEEYYYRHERREVGPYRGDRDRDRDRDHDWGMVKHDRRRRDEDYWSDDDHHHHRRNGGRRERSESPNHHHKLHLAEGALAGAGVSALLASRRDKNGEIGDHRGRKVMAGAALGALGTEVLKRAHSAYEDTWTDGRESPDHHSTLKKTLGVAAVALAAAGVAKLYEANKIEKEERRRGRSRGRDYSSGEEYSRSRSRSRPKSRRRSLSTFAKAAVGTAVTAGVVKHLHNQSKSRSRSRHSRHGSRSRSKSKIRRGAEIAGAAAAAGVAGKLWKDHHDKKKREGPVPRGQSDDGDGDDRDYRRRRSASRSGDESRSRSRARSLHSDAGADPGLGLIEYGRDPIDQGLRSASGRGYEAEAEERRRNRRRRRDRSASSDSGSERERSRSQLRDVAAVGAGAVGLKEYKDRQDKENEEKRERENREREKEEDKRRNREERERERERVREREREQRRERKEREKWEREQNKRRDNEAPPPGNNGGYYPDQYPQSPPHVSGGAYFPPYPAPPAEGPGYHNPPYRETASAPPQREYQPYVPQDYIAYAPPPPPAGPPPPTMSGANGGYEPPSPASAPLPGAPPLPGPPPIGGIYPPPPDHVSDHSRSRSRRKGGKPEGGVKSSRTSRSSRAPPSADIPPPAPTPPPQLTKSVSFGPLSPKSSRTMDRHRRQVDSGGSEAEEGSRDRSSEKSLSRSYGHRRRTSDTSHDRPRLANHDTESESEVEDLPERFDSQGRPLDKSDSAGGNRWTSRSGTFNREPQRPSDWNIRGAWNVGGTDPEQVDRLVRHVTGALEGRSSWMGVIGEVLGSGLLQGGTGGQHAQDEGRGEGRGERGGEDGEDGDKRRKRKR